MFEQTCCRFKKLKNDQLPVPLISPKFKSLLRHGMERVRNALILNSPVESLYLSLLVVPAQPALLE